MESTKEKSFYEALGTVPAVSDRVLENVERRVRMTGVKRRTALAACLLLTFIIPALLLTNHLRTSAVCAEEYEAMDELLYAFDFLGGDVGQNQDQDYLLDADVVADVAADNSKKSLPFNEKTAPLNTNSKEGSNEK